MLHLASKNVLGGYPQARGTPEGLSLKGLLEVTWSSPCSSKATHRLLAAHCHVQAASKDPRRGRQRIYHIIPEAAQVCSQPRATPVPLLLPQAASPCSAGQRLVH